MGKLLLILTLAPTSPRILGKPTSQGKVTAQFKRSMTNKIRPMHRQDLVELSTHNLTLKSMLRWFSNRLERRR